MINYLVNAFAMETLKELHASERNVPIIVNIMDDAYLQNFMLRCKILDSWQRILGAQVPPYVWMVRAITEITRFVGVRTIMIHHGTQT